MNILEVALRRFSGYRLYYIEFFGASFLSIILVWIYSWNFTDGDPYTSTENIWFGVLLFSPFIVIYTYMYLYRHKRVYDLMKNQKLIYANFDKVDINVDFGDDTSSFYHLWLHWIDPSGMTHKFVSDSVHNEFNCDFNKDTKKIEDKVNMYMRAHPQGIPVMIDSQNYANYKVDTSWLIIKGPFNKIHVAEIVLILLGTIGFGILTFFIIQYNLSPYQFLQGLF